MKKIYTLSAILCLLISSLVHAGTYTANVVSGNWSLTTTWTPTTGTPGIGDIAIIPTGKTVILDASQQCLDLTVTGTLTSSTAGKVMTVELKVMVGL